MVAAIALIATIEKAAEDDGRYLDYWRLQYCLNGSR
jgi:hypothetical protein